MSMITEEEIKETLKQVYDPEIGIDIVNLGLVYGIEKDEENGVVKVKHTLTSPGCPLGPIIQGQAHQALLKLPGVKDVKMELVWEPQWDPHTMCSEEAKMDLGIF
ncbi:MAG: metal-sulfur cluster assembly factor [Candidatus Eremiobacteraeota bacterium]|jgi:metal-sulfur cluster biosynthetic enzyme|nr:metal-sulfur cluster assembly factor [Candidatus Eremiobacteraeota bacterium]MCL5055034.1 metal-sulfur cluster assembly factor [Bacillota bacterium]